MSNRNWRRVVGLLAASSVALLAAAAQPVVGSASASGTLFALGPTIVAKADPATGSLTTFANLPLTPPTQPASAFNELASDPTGHRLFTVRTTFSDFGFTTIAFQLITIDTRTAAVTISPNMAQGITGLVFDPTSGKLFGQTNACCPFQLVQIDLVTGAQTHVADIPGVQPLKMTVAAGKHTIYFDTESFVLGQPQPVINLVAIDTVTGVVSVGPQLSTGIFAFVYDSSSAALFGKTFCCPAGIVRVDPLTGTETPIASNLNLGSGITIDSASHTIYMTDDELGAFGFNQFIQSVNDQTGVVAKSSGPLPSNTFIGNLAFEGVAITPESIETDVQNALAAGAIDSAGVANSLLAKLDAASAARARGQCSTAANSYQAFINEVSAQSGKHIAAATASQLVSEAQFLVANCP